MENLKLLNTHPTEEKYTIILQNNLPSFNGIRNIVEC